MKIKVSETVDISGGRVLRAGTYENLPQDMVDEALASGKAEEVKQTATRKTRTKKATKSDASSDVHE